MGRSTTLSARCSQAASRDGCCPTQSATGISPRCAASSNRSSTPTCPSGLPLPSQTRCSAADNIGYSDMDRIRRDMDEVALRRLQPHHIHAFFDAARTQLGGRPHERTAAAIRSTGRRWRCATAAARSAPRQGSPTRPASSSTASTPPARREAGPTRHSPTTTRCSLVPL